MSEPGSRRGRVHDAEGAREAILNAAEEVFAEHGFDGARIDAIAEVAGYNKSLIFHYYDDKLGLYSEVLKRIDQQASEFQASLLEPLLADEQLTSDASKFRTFLRAVMRLIFDFLVEHPRILRMLAWEGAEGWQSMRKIASQFSSDDVQLFRRLLGKAQEAGLIRPGRDPYMMFTIAYSTCLSYLTFTPLLELAFEEDLSSPDALERAKELIAEFVIDGMMVDPPEAKL
jgi:TetR/AcrR family transcriptional regulator